jgi:polyhydroxyalkanoate synthesis regulator phasin
MKNMNMVKKYETKTIPKRQSYEEELEELRRRIQKLPEITIEPPE